jgi:hypothetical protein
MMGGGAFLLLKTGRRGPESAKQAEIRLAGLLKILDIAGPGRRMRSQNAQRTYNGCVGAYFREIWLIGRGTRPLLSRSQF